MSHRIPTGGAPPSMGGRQGMLATLSANAFANVSRKPSDGSKRSPARTRPGFEEWIASHGPSASRPQPTTWCACPSCLRMSPDDECSSPSPTALLIEGVVGCFLQTQWRPSENEPSFFNSLLVAPRDLLRPVTVQRVFAL